MTTHVAESSEGSFRDRARSRTDNSERPKETKKLCDDTLRVLSLCHKRSYICLVESANILSFDSSFIQEGYVLHNIMLRKIVKCYKNGVYSFRGNQIEWRAQRRPRSQRVSHSS